MGRGEARALLLTDVVDSTKLSEELGDAAMARVWAAHDRVARDLLGPHRGREIDKTDGFLLLFDAASDAVAYALAYHRAIGALDPPLKARAGLHVGPVILTENPASDVARGAKPLEVDGLAKPTAARVMGLATGGQTLLTAEAKIALGPTDLRVESHGFWRMKGVSEPVELFEVGGPDAPFTPPPDGAKVYRVARQGDLWLPVREVPHHLPRERDGFVGRAADLQDLAGRFDDGAALVSLLGVGGTGKTRLAVRYGWTWLGDWPGGVWFCDLVDARDAEGIASGVARSLGVDLGTDPLTQLGAAIASRGRCLVILDNFEQVARHAGETAGRWLSRAPKACFLVTTREVLGLPGEQVVALTALDRDAAVELFAARAAAAKRGYELTPAERPHVEALVDLLDRLPLCIELAAARVRVMDARTMVARMGERFQLLALGGARRDRQATMRGTLDWSWDLLDAAEQSALAQLAVFAGGFTLQDAEGVLDLSGQPGERWTVDVVQALVDKSLVVAVGEGRFDLLVSVQVYASERLDASGARLAAEAAHAAWFARLGGPAGLARINGCGGALARLEAAAERENLIVACRRSIAADRPDVALAALLALREILHTVPLGTLLRLSEDLLGLPSVAPRHVVLGGIVGMKAANRAGRREWEAAFRTRIVEAPPCGDEDVALARANLGMFGDAAEARLVGEELLRRARSLGNLALEGGTLCNLGSRDFFEGRYDEAEAKLTQALPLLIEVGHAEFEHNTRINLVWLFRALGRDAEARDQVLTARARAAALGFRGGEAILLDFLATLDFEDGRLQDSVDGYRAAHRMLEGAGMEADASRAWGNIGETLLAQGMAREARSYFQGAADAASPLGDATFVVHWNARAAEAAWLSGDLVAAREHATTALAVAGHVETTARRRAEFMVALVDLEQGRVGEARAALEAVTSWIAAHGQASHRTQTCVTLARACLAQGDVPGAERALALARSMPLEPLAEALLATHEALVAVACGDRVAAEAALEAACVLPELLAPGSEHARWVALARAGLAGLDAGLVARPLQRIPGGGLR